MLKPAKSVVSAVSVVKLQSAAMAPSQFNGPSNGDSRRPQTYTITGLKRWSVVNKEIPGKSPYTFIVDHVGSWLTDLRL
jgi:hypothetical protein